MRLLKKIICSTVLTGGIIAALGSGINTYAYVNAPSEYFNQKYYDEVAPASYYSTVNTSLTGDAFKNNLYDIISSGYVQHGYKDNNTVLKYTDPDPNKAGNVIGFYSGESLNGGWNKEHVWAKSHGFPDGKNGKPSYSNSEPYSDAHHLRPTLSHINSTRSNYDFGEVDGIGDQYGNKLGNIKGGYATVFEPRDAVKGDVARMMFYMETRYGSKTKFNLKLVEDEETSLSVLNGRFGNLSTLLKWHYQDPVSKEEIYRNNVIYDNFQKNRNPYIDHPEYVDIAYPNEQSNLPIDDVKVNNVINRINSLPLTITISDKALVNEVNSLYLSLNYKERLKVSNYSKLEAAINTINDLENPKPTPEPDYNQANVDNVINLINMIPTNITADSKNYVENAWLAYSYLTASEKKAVTNYSKLAEAKMRLDEILNPGGGSNPSPDTPVVGGDKIEIDFSNPGLKNTSYVNNYSFTIGDKSFLASSAYVSGNELRIGTNDKKHRLDNKYGLGSIDAAALDFKFKVDNINNISFNVTKKYGTINSVKVLLLEDGASSYSELGVVNLTNGLGAVNISLDKPKSGLISLIFIGSTPRAVLSKLTITTKAPTPAYVDTFIQNQTKASLKMIYNETSKTITDLDLRFGGLIPVSAYNSSSKYGVYLTLDKNPLNHGLNDKAALDKKGYFVQCTPVRVNKDGNVDINGEHYQFAAVITNMEGHYNDIITGAFYMENPRGLYLSNSVSYSASSLAKYYVENVELDQVVKEILMTI